MQAVYPDQQTILQLYDHLPDIINWYCPVFEDGVLVDFELRYCNQPFIKDLNVNSTEIIGRRLKDSKYTDHDTIVPIVEQCRKVYETGEPLDVTYYSPRYDQFLQVTRKRVLDGVLCVVRIRTEEFRLSLEKQQQALLINSIVDASPTCIVLCEAVRNIRGRVDDFLILSVNEKVARDLQLPKDAIEGQTYAELHPDVRHNGYLDMLRAVVESGSPYRGEMYLEVFGGWFFVSADRVETDKVVVICLNINESKQAFSEIERLVEELRRSNANLEEFAYAASHDLKEPIRKIQFFSDRIFTEYAHLFDERAQGYMNRLSAASDRMRTLVEDLLSYSQVSLRPKVFEPVDLSGIMKIVLSDLELDISERGATVEIPELPLLPGHARQLQQLFINLVGNALKYTRPGVAPEISVTATRVQGRSSGTEVALEDGDRSFYRISIADNGIGFEQKEATRIFQVFQRLHGNSEYRGTGVGLSIARKVAENHYGYIWAEGRPNEGATFHVLLPAAAHTAG